MPKVRTFDTGEADYKELRTKGGGVQKVCEWVTPADGHHNSIGVAELHNIRIAEYRFGFSDFLYVTGGSVRIIQDGITHDLTPGQAILIPEGAVVTMEVKDWLRWIYITDPGNWRDLMDTPGSVEAMSPDAPAAQDADTVSDLKNGAKIRQDILGPEYLDPLTGGSNAFDTPWQDLVTEMLWGRVWGGSNLSDDLKLKLNIAIFTVLGKPEDLVPYVRAAAKRGTSFDDIREIIMQAAMYAGLPKGFTAIYAARSVFDEMNEGEHHPLPRKD